MPEDFYESLASDYERMTDEEARLKTEIPFIEHAIRENGGHEILDIGCGTGGHARALGALGLKVLGLDPSRAMIERAQIRTSVEGVRYEVGTIADLTKKGLGRFDVATCLGNTLPHLVSEEISLAKVSRQMAPLVRRGGLLIGQIVNVPWVEAAGMRMLPVRSWSEGGKKSIMTRHYVNTGGNSVLLLVSHLFLRTNDTMWKGSAKHQHLLKIVPMELERAFDSGPWVDYKSYGGWNGEPLDVSSPSIVFVTTRR